MYTCCMNDSQKRSAVSWPEAAYEVEIDVDPKVSDWKAVVQALSKFSDMKDLRLETAPDQFVPVSTLPEAPYQAGKVNLRSTLSDGQLTIPLHIAYIADEMALYFYADPQDVKAALRTALHIENLDSRDTYVAMLETFFVRALIELYKLLPFSIATTGWENEHDDRNLHEDKRYYLQSPSSIFASLVAEDGALHYYPTTFVHRDDPIVTLLPTTFR